MNSESMHLEAARPIDVKNLCGANAGGAARLGRVAVYDDPADAFPFWDRLDATAAVTPYQTRRWLMPWLETTGRASGITPCIIVAFDPAGEPLALLPFATWRQGSQRVAGFLGGRDSNFNLGLFKPGTTWTPDMLLALLLAAARSGKVPVDLFALCNQPHDWNGVPNPFLQLPHQPSPSFGYKVNLTADPEAFIRTILSGDNRRKLRQKTARLQGLGPVRHEVARTPDTGRAIIDALVEQRLSRCRTQGLNASDLPDLRRFLERSSIVDQPAPSVELHALICGDRIVATFAGTSHHGRFSGMVISFDADPDVARCSPGEILMESLVKSKCVEGFEVFDLGVGEGRYKQAYCPQSEPLFDSLIAVSARAKLLAISERARLKVKRRIKQSPRAWAAIRSFRKIFQRFRHYTNGP